MTHHVTMPAQGPAARRRDDKVQPDSLTLAVQSARDALTFYRRGRPARRLAAALSPTS